MSVRPVVMETDGLLYDVRIKPFDVHRRPVYDVNAPYLADYCD